MHEQNISPNALKSGAGGDKRAAFSLLITTLWETD